MKISVEEEFGIRLWEWDYPGTEEEFLADWKAKRGPFNPARGTVTMVRGHRHVDDPYLRMEEAVEDEFYENSIFIWMHTPDDSAVRFRGEIIPWDEEAWNERLPVDPG